MYMNILSFHSSAEAVVLAAGFGQGFGDIYLDDIRCNGSEADLFDCPSSGYVPLSKFKIQSTFQYWISIVNTISIVQYLIQQWQAI